MTPSSPIARIAAGVVALAAWTALTLQFVASVTALGAVFTTLWVMLRYFTILANVAVALVFIRAALRREGPAPPARVGGVTVMILLVGVVYALLLNGVFPVTGLAAVADTLLHRVVPGLVILYWLLVAPKGGLRARDPWLWAVIPTLYLGYALLRGRAEGVYAYPFLDPAPGGWGSVAVTALAIAAGFLATGFALVGLDRWLGRRAGGKPAARRRGPQ